MAKKSKLSTPAWILEGYDSPAEYNKAMQGTKFPTSSKESEDFSTKGIDNSKKKKGRTFRIRECPECGSDDVGIVLSNSDAEEGGGNEWECHKCGWKGSDINEKELDEDEFMKYLDERGEPVG